MLLINNRPVYGAELEALVKKALNGRKITPEDSIIEFQLMAWRINPNFKADEPEEGQRRFLGPMYCNIPDKYRAKDHSNPKSQGLVYWRYMTGEGVKNERGEYITTNTDVEFHAGYIRVDVNRHPDLYVFLKFADICLNNPTTEVGASQAIYKENNPYADKKAGYAAELEEASRIATIYRMSAENAAALASGLKLVFGEDLKDSDIVKGALISFAKADGRQFDLHADNEALVLENNIHTLINAGKLVFEPNSRSFAMIYGDNEQKTLANIPADRLADKERCFAEKLLAGERQTLEIIRNLARQ